MTFEEYWAIVAEKTGKTVTKEQLKYYCEMAYGQGQASSVRERQKGKWIVSGYIDTCRGYVAKCPFCEEDTVGGGDFCKHCGADMREIFDDDPPMEYFENGGI